MLLARIKRYFSSVVRRPAAGEALDRALDLWRIESPDPDLARRIVATAMMLPQAAGGVGAVRQQPRGVPVWPFPLLWPGAAAFALAIVLGYLAAAHGLRGAETAGEWLNMADVAALQEDIGDL